jgi:hypothetical protein
MSDDGARARLSWIEFLDAIEEIAQFSCNSNGASRWIVESSSQPKEAIGSRWLVQRNDIKQVPIDQTKSVELEALNDDEEEEEEIDVEQVDFATLLPTNRHSDNAHTLIFEWHVCYRAAFQAPALYFRVAELDGAPLTDDVILPADCSVPRSAITQAPHPVLETPFWHIHPCETAQAMSVPLRQLSPPSALPLSRNYVAVWLSMYAVPLGVNSLFQSSR